MKLRFFWPAVFLVVGLVAWGLTQARADSYPQIDLPYGIGTLQLPWQYTEVVYGEMKPIKGGLWHQIAGASLPILTLGKLSGGERIIDGSLGGVATIPSQGAIPDAYAGLGHDFAQDIPGLKNYPSAHLNVGGSYANAAGGWSWGGTASFAPGGSPSQPPTPVVAPPASSKLEIYPSITGI